MNQTEDQFLLFNIDDEVLTQAIEESAACAKKSLRFFRGRTKREPQWKMNI